MSIGSPDLFKETELVKKQVRGGLVFFPKGTVVVVGKGSKTAKEVYAWIKAKLMLSEWGKVNTYTTTFAWVRRKAGSKRLRLLRMRLRASDGKVRVFYRAPGRGVSAVKGSFCTSISTSGLYSRFYVQRDYKYAFDGKGKVSFSSSVAASGFSQRSSGWTGNAGSSKSGVYIVAATAVFILWNDDTGADARISSRTKRGRATTLTIDGRLYAPSLCGN